MRLHFEVMKTCIAIFLLLLASTCIQGQSCRPAAVTYIVRDAKGKTLNDTTLKTIINQVSKPTPQVTSVALAKDGTLVGYSARETAKTLPAIYAADAATCRLKVGEWTLKYAGKTMHLIFDLDLDRTAYTIDSLPFQNGIFQLDQKDLTDLPSDQIVPARTWRKVRKLPLRP